MAKRLHPTVESLRQILETETDSCDNCDCQEDSHYCLLYSIAMKNMDLYICDDWEEENA